MIIFTLESATPIGSAIIADNGDTRQNVSMRLLVSGILKTGVSVMDTEMFTVPNSEIVGYAQPATAFWDYIKNVLIPAYIAANYTAI